MLLLLIFNFNIKFWFQSNTTYNLNIVLELKANHPTLISNDKCIIAKIFISHQFGQNFQSIINFPDLKPK